VKPTAAEKGGDDQEPDDESAPHEARTSQERAGREALMEIREKAPGWESKGAARGEVSRCHGAFSTDGRAKRMCKVFPLLNQSLPPPGCARSRSMYGVRGGRVHP